MPQISASSFLCVSLCPSFLLETVYITSNHGWGWLYSWSRLNLSIQSPRVSVRNWFLGTTWIPRSRDAQVPTVDLPIHGSASSDSSHHIRVIFSICSRSDGWMAYLQRSGWMCSQRSYWLNEVMFTGTKGWLGFQYIFWQWHNSTHTMLLDQNNWRRTTFGNIFYRQPLVPPCWKEVTQPWKAEDKCHDNSRHPR